MKALSESAESETQEQIEKRLRQSSEHFQYRERIGSQTHAVQRLPELFQPRSQEFLVPRGYYFFMGDNRDNSNDSRERGFVPRSYLKGRALGIIASFAWDGALPTFRPERFAKAL